MLFDRVFQNSRWHGADKFSSSEEWKTEIEKWLVFIDKKNQLGRYKPRLNDRKTARDLALAEIFAAYLMETELNYPVTGWEKRTVGGRDVDFVLSLRGEEIYCEVKSPGWESELLQEERLSCRKELNKIVQSEVRSIAPWKSIRYAIKKSYSKFLSNTRNLLIIKDDLFVSILDAPLNINIALFEDKGIYDGKLGCFCGEEYNRIGGLLVIDCKLKENIEYRCMFIPNNNALKPFFIN